MPFSPYTSPYTRNNLNDDDDDDDDESESGIASESGIFTYDGQYTVASASPSQIMQESDRVAQELDNSLDYGSLISGIQDSSFLMNESLYRAKLREDEAQGRVDYSLDESSLDLGEYTKMPYPKGASSPVNISTAAVMRTTNPTTEDSIFSTAYTRVMKAFLFPSKKNQKDEQGDEETGKTTPKTLSPKDSEDVQGFQDDEASQDDDPALQGRPTKTIVLGKTPPRTPKQRLEDYNNRGNKNNGFPQTPRTVQESTITVYSETKILGLRLSRLLCIILLILVAAVAVAVGSAVAMQDNSSSEGRSSAGNEQRAPFPTSSPVVSVVQTLAPSTENVFDETAESAPAPTALPTSSPTQPPIMATQAPTAPLPTGAPSFPLSTQTPTLQPLGITATPSGPAATGVPTAVTVPPTALLTQNPSSAPVSICGVDDDVTTFVLFNEDRNCAWFR